MKRYQCSVCESELFFENSVCTTCGTPLGYSRGERTIVALDPSGTYVDDDGWIWHVCCNLNLSGCTWLAPLAGGQCSSCDMTRTRPNDADLEGLQEYPEAERAKRYLLAELDHLGLTVPTRAEDPENGLCFDLLSSANENVTIGHADGVITIDLAESDDAHRAKVREQLDEPYRTMLGHFRHEFGHYAEWQLVRTDEAVTRCRALFGDERADYQRAIDQHYAHGAPTDWREAYISTYATMHPYEDFAETWAHMLHILDTVDTARWFTLISAAEASRSDFRGLVTDVWVPLSTALNAVNRSMGKSDLYPFVIPAPVLDKLAYTASLLP